MERGVSGDSGPGGGGGAFATLLAELSEQLRREHQREVNDLRLRVQELGAQLDSARGAQPWRRGVLGRHPAESAHGAPPSLLLDSGGEPPDEEARPSAVRQTTASRTWDRVNTLIGNDSPKRLSFSRQVMRSVEGESTVQASCGVFMFFERLVQTNAFEVTFSFLIAVNAIAMAIEAQYFSIEVGNIVGYHSIEATVAWPWAESLFNFFGWFFGPVFILEIVLRVLGLRARYMRDCWNWLDLIIGSLWVIGKLQNNLPVNPQLIRLTRLGKLMRLIRLVKNINGLDSLFLITTSLRSSISILFWTFVMLGLVQMLNALLLHQLLSEFYFRNVLIAEAERREVYRYFGTFTSSLFSMFELTLANWPTISRTLYENVSQWFIFFAIVHKVTIGFALIGIINGVFMQETFKVAQQDDELMVRQGRRAINKHMDKMKRLVATADRTGEGKIDLDEFRQIFLNPALSAWLSSMELVPRDVDQLFKMMDDGDGALTVEELIHGVAKFRGTARNIDLHTFMHDQRHLQDLVEKHMERVERHLSGIHGMLELEEEAHVLNKHSL